MSHYLYAFQVTLCYLRPFNEPKKSLKSGLGIVVPLMIFSADLLQRRQSRFVGLSLPVNEIGRLLFGRDFSHYFLYRFPIHSLRSTTIYLSVAVPAPGRPIRLSALLLAEFQVIVYRVAELLLQLLDARALEGDHVSQIEHLAVKQSRFIVELSVCPVYPLYFNIPLILRCVLFVYLTGGTL